MGIRGGGSDRKDAWAKENKPPCVEGSAAKCGCGATMRTEQDHVVHLMNPGEYCDERA